MRKIIVWALVALLSLTCFASASAEQAAAWDTATEDTIVLSVINNYYTAGWKKAAEDYMALHPETRVVVDVVADNDTYLQKMTTWLTADDLTQAADIVHINFAQSAMGGYNVMYEKNLIYDFSKMLDEVNPYNEGKLVSEAFNAQDIVRYNDSGRLYALPFDWVGIAIIYNQTMLDQYGIALPTTYEQFVAACQALKEAGVESPIAASGEASWYLSAFADAALRGQEEVFLTQPGDGMWDEASMAANVGFQFDESNLACDLYTVWSPERAAAYKTGTQFKDEITRKVWEQFAGIAKYFQPNYIESASTEVMTSFEVGNSAFLLSGSWNVGAINSDLTEMGEDAFEWGSMPFPSYEVAPEGFAQTIRSLYVTGNTMGIVLSHGEGDHLERVKDFFKYVYSPNGCQDMFTTTLNAGNYVQGPPAILGVTLSDEINAKLVGFIQEGSLKGDFGGIVGQDATLPSDKGAYVELVNKLLAGEIDAATFCEGLSPLAMNRVQDDIEKNGFDLDPLTKDEVKK